MSSDAKVHERPRAMADLEGIVGRSLPLDQVNGMLRRAAQSLGRFNEYGACMVTCSDEFQGEVRLRFDRDVARPLMAMAALDARRIFAVSNLGGRVEPGAIALADDHFTVKSRKGGAKLILIPIAAHVGRRRQGHEFVWGEIDRFGRRSPCCGALKMLLDPPAAVASVRYPWFDQLSAFFGERRVEALRADPMRMVKTAVVHAVLQSETALADVFRDPPAWPTRFLIVPMVIVNHEGPDDAILVGVHDVLVEDGNPDVVHGTALRTTPEALTVIAEGGRVTITSDEGFEKPVVPPIPQGPHAAPVEAAPPPLPLPAPMTPPPAALERIRDARADMHRLKRHPHLSRVYARPILRGLLQGLSVLAPELALAALAFEGGESAVRTHRLRKLLARGPSTEDARRVLHDVEAEIQQLGHREAREVLDLLTAESSPLFG